ATSQAPRPAPRVSDAACDALKLFQRLKFGMLPRVTDFLERFWPHFSGLVVLVLMAVAAGHAVMYKRDSRAAVAWVGLILLSPFFGALFYCLFGVNRIRRLAVVLKGDGTTDINPAAVEPEVIPRRAPHMEGLCRLGEKVTGLPLTRGNRIRSEERRVGKAGRSRWACIE